MPLTAPWHVIPSLAPTKLIVGELLCSFPLSPCEAPHSHINPDRVSLRFSCRPSRENTSSRDNSCLGGLFLDHPPSVPFPELPLGGRGQDDCGQGVLRGDEWPRAAPCTQGCSLLGPPCPPSGLTLPSWLPCSAETVTSSWQTSYIITQRDN